MRRRSYCRRARAARRRETSVLFEIKVENATGCVWFRLDRENLLQQLIQWHLREAPLFADRYTSVDKLPPFGVRAMGGVLFVLL